MAVPDHKPVICPVIIGRSSQREILRSAVEEARNGRGRIVLVAGEAGVGKSRLVAEARARAEQEGLLVLQGHCFEADRSLPYAPLLDLLRAALAFRPPEDIVPHLADQAGELVAILPELAHWLPALTRRPALDPEGDKRRLFQALALSLAHLAGRRPTCLIIEDLHWGDETSLDFLLHFAYHLAAAPLLVLLTYRSDEVQSPLGHLLAEFDRGRLAVELQIGVLTLAEVEAMLRAIFDLRRPVREDFLRELHTLTDGNPFFIEEVLKGISLSGDRDGESFAPDRASLQSVRVPRTLQEVVQRRSRRLRPATFRALALAAVIGRHFDFALLQEAVGADEAEVLQWLKELIAAQLVVELSSERFAFRHALTRQAIYTDLLARERRALHLTVGETLERCRDATDDAPAAELSYHFYEAGAWARARHYAEQAGERAQALYASRAAVDMYTRAVDATRRLGLAPTPAIHRARGLARETLGDFDGARADHETALELARAADDRRAEWRALLDLGLLWAGRDYARAGDFLRHALGLARELGDPGILGLSLNRLGNWQMNVEALAVALAFHEEALAIFRRLDDRRGIAETLDLISSALLTGGDLARGMASSRQAVAQFRELDNRVGLASILAVRVHCGVTYLTDTLRPVMEISEAVREGELGLQTARAIGWRAGEAFAGLALGQCLAAHGDYARALTLARESLAIADEIGHRQWLTAAHCSLGFLLVDLFSPTAQQHLERARVLAHEVGSLIWERYTTAPLALAYIARHDFARADAALSAALGDTAPMETLGQRLCWSARAELALARGAPDLALRIIDQLVATVPGDAGELPIPRLWKLRGEALLMLDRVAEAEAVLSAACEAARAQGSRPLLWRIHIARGRLYRLQARHKEAGEAFTEARAIIEDLAARLPEELRADFLRQATAPLPRPRPPAPGRAAREESGGLTRREREVAVLIARGLTNRQIAASLVIADETVAVHVKHILDKLDFASRAQVAAWVVQHGFSATILPPAAG